MSKIAGAMGRRRLPPEEDPPEVADATAAFASAINAAVGPDLSMEPAPELGPGARPSAGMMAITEATARRQAELKMDNTLIDLDKPDFEHRALLQAEGSLHRLSVDCTLCRMMGSHIAV